MVRNTLHGEYTSRLLTAARSGLRGLRTVMVIMPATVARPIAKRFFTMDMHQPVRVDHNANRKRTQLQVAVETLTRN